MDRKEQEVFDQEIQDEASVSRLVGELKHVEAPANFERRVMSRIANGEPAARRPFLGIPALAFAALLVMLVGVFLAYRSANDPSDQFVVIDTDYIKPDAQPVPTAETQAQPDRSLTAGSGINPQPVPTDAIRHSTVSPNNAGSNRIGGSYDTGQGQTRTPNPEGINPQNPRTSLPNQNDVVSAQPLSVKDILETLGISADFSNGWKVSQVAANSMAARSGVQAGDVVIALGDNDISNKTKIENSGSVGNVRVRRSGKVVDIKLK